MSQRSIVVTGAFGALGSAVATAFANRGDIVSLIDAATIIPDAVRSRFPAPHLLYAAVDLTQWDGARTTFERIGSERGIDVLVNVAGGFLWEKLADGDTTAFDRMFAINLKTAVVAARTALPHLLRSRAGRIVNIGAGAAAAHSGAGMGAYAASKAGVHRFTESLADELKESGVTVNAVLPGTIDTPANRRDMPNADHSRWVAPGDIAAVIVFLASDGARSINGALVPVNGRA